VRGARLSSDELQAMEADIDSPKQAQNSSVFPFAVCLSMRRGIGLAAVGGTCARYHP